VKTNEVDLSDLVESLARASKLEVAKPPVGVTLPVTGLAAPLSRKTIGDALGPAVDIDVQARSLVLTIDSMVLRPEFRPGWEQRIRDLSARAEREAQRRRNYGLHALESYRPNDPTRPTVCLIHGVNSSSHGFVHMIRPIEEAGYGVVVYDYAFNKNLDESCRQFARDWAAFRAKVGEKRPWSIIAHSMGTLVSRAYVEGPLYGSDVSTLIMIAPVNQGSSLAKTQTLMQLIDSVNAVNGLKRTDPLAHLGDGLGEAAEDMTPGSDFLKRLNERPRRSGVAYHILAGDSAFLPADVRRSIEVPLAGLKTASSLFGGITKITGNDDLPDRLDEITVGRGDGCVSVARTRLEGVADHVVIHANHAELIRAPLLFADPGPVACMPYLLKWLEKPAVAAARPR
jgi:pimeloyl-ACP methyl ester carboxylesterase